MPSLAIARGGSPAASCGGTVRARVLPSLAIARGGSPAASCGGTVRARVLPSLAIALLLVAIGVVAGCAKPDAPAPSSLGKPATESVATPPAAEPAPTADERPVAKGDGKVRDISFDDVKLPLEKGDPFTPDILPDAVKALERQTVRIRGYILPSFQQRGIEQFVLVRDNMECCFGPGALLHDCVVVRMRPGKSTDFSIRPVAVTGTFRIEELKGPDGRHLAVYALDGERVE